MKAKKFKFRAWLFDANVAGEALLGVEEEFRVNGEDPRLVALNRAVELLGEDLEDDPRAKSIRLEYVRPV